MPHLGVRQLARLAIVLVLLAVLGAALYTSAVLAYRVGEGGASRPPLWVLLAASALLVVLLPGARRQAERFANRLVYGEQAGAYELMSRFVARMAGTLAVDDVLPRLAETAARSVHATRGEVRLWLADGGEWRQSWSPFPEVATSGENLTLAVEHRGSAVGEIGIAATPSGLRPTDRRVLADLVGPAGLALSTVRLTLELRRRVEELLVLRGELEASRLRLVQARSVERSGFAAAVAGSLQPRLAAARRNLAAGEVAGARAEVTEALSGVRELARGVFPALLASAGLERALASFADLAGLELALEVSGDQAKLRRHPAHEAALYACAAAQLGSPPGRDYNRGVKPPAAACTLRLEVADAASMTLSSRGGGIARLDASQLEWLRDRVEALGGSLARPPEGELLLEVVLPLPAFDEAVPGAAGAGRPRPGPLA